MDEVLELIDAFLVEVIGRNMVPSSEVADRLLDIRLAAFAAACHDETMEAIP